MFFSLNSGVSALDQFQQEINVIANNIANVNTTGFKASTVNFADTFSQTLGANAAGSLQVGTGVTTSSITSDFSAGSTQATGSKSDLAIQGSGFFVVKDAVSGSTYVTRDGSFTVDSSGYLVTSGGLRVQGAAGDIRPGDGTTPPNFTIGSDGTVTVTAGGNNTIAGQITLQNFANPNQLVKVGGNLYTAPAAAGGLAAAVAPGAGGTGALRAGSLEMSNVDLAGELTSLISAQRAYEANSKVVSTSDDILQTLVNLKR